MHKAPASLLAALVTLGSNSLSAQTETVVHIRVSSETCRIDNVDVPCSDVGAKLGELGTPLGAHLQLSVDKNASYAAVSAALESIRRSPFKLKIGYVNVGPQ